jgi:hypothetical protein
MHKAHRVPDTTISSQEVLGGGKSSFISSKGLVRVFKLAVFAVVVGGYLATALTHPVKATYANGYNYRRTITIDHTKVTGGASLSNFPVLINGTYSYLATVANGGKVTNSSGYDIIFTSDSSGSSQLNHEIEKYVSTTGEVEMWVNVPSVSNASDTVIYMFYNNSSISTTQEHKTSVWDSNFKAVWHMHNTGGVGTLNDSTSNSNNLTWGSAQTSGDLVTGQIDGAQDFDGTVNDVVSKSNPTANLNINTNITLEGWVKRNDSNAVILMREFGTPVNYSLNIANGNTTDLDFTYKTFSATDTYRFAFANDNTWRHVAITYTFGTGSSIKAYVNGSLVSGSWVSGAGNDTVVNDDTMDFWIGNAQSNPFTGQLDEFRLSNSIRSAGWIGTQYNNQNSPSTFYTVGSETTSTSSVTNNLTINFQGKLANLSTGTNLMVGSPACIKVGSDTCDFQIRIWNDPTASSTTAGSGNLLFTQTFQDVEIGDNGGIFALTFNSCGSANSGNSQLGTSVGTCTAVDDSDADSDPGINFNRTDLYFEISFAPSDTSGSLGSFSEVFTRSPLTSVPSTMYSQITGQLGGLGTSNYVQIAPSTIQTTGNTSNTLIWLNENGVNSPNLVDFRNTSSVFKVSNSGGTAIGSGTLPNTWVALAASSTTSSQINLVSTSAVDPSVPNKGDFWYNGTNLNFYDGTRTIDMLPTNSQGWVKLQPTSVQAAGSTQTLIWLNSTAGTPNLIDLQVGGTSRFTVNNAGQLQLSRQGSTGGLLIGGDASIYRNGTTDILTPGNLSIGTTINDVLAISGTSTFYGNLRAVPTIANGSTTANGAGTSSNTLTVASTANFDAGNLVLINGSTYAYIESIDNSVQMTITPAATWSNGNTVVEYTLPSVGGDGTLAQQRFSGSMWAGFITGGGTATTYGNGYVLSDGGLNISAQTASGDLNLSTQSSINVSTSGGLMINKTAGSNATAGWAASIPNTNSGLSKYDDRTSVQYNGKFYIWGGYDPVNTGGTNTMDIYDFATSTWSSGTAGGSAGRSGSTSIAYNNKWYIWGGCIGANGCAGGSNPQDNTMDIYDFTTGTWSTGTTGGTARAWPTSVAYNGKWYIWGGNNNLSGPLNTMDIYDLATGTWTTGTTGGTARYWAMGGMYQNKWYIWGGYSGGYSSVLNMYDFNLGTWSTLASGGTGRSNAASVVYGSKMYIFGGISTGQVISNVLATYDFALNSWTTVSSGNARYDHQATAYDGKMYIFQGQAASGNANIDVYDFGLNDRIFTVSSGVRELWNIDTSNVLNISGGALGLRYVTDDAAQDSTKGWTTGTAGGASRTFIQGVTYNDKLYIWGGIVGGNAVNTMDIYDFKTGTWGTGTAGGTARRSYSAGLYNGKIYYWAGCTTNACSGVNVNNLDIYDIATDSWSTGTSGGTARNSHVGVIYNGKFYNWSGFTTVVVNTMDIYNIATDTWTTGATGGTAKSNATAVIYKDKMYSWSGFTTLGVNTMDVYDFLTNTWSTGTAGGTARYAASALVYDGKLWGWSGLNSSNVAINTMDVYDFDRNVWAVGTAGGTSRRNMAAVVYNGKMYLQSAATMDVYDFGISNAQTVFSLGKPQGVGPDDGKLFRFDATGRAYTADQGGWYSVGADYAEYMYTADTTLTAGEIVRLDETTDSSIRRVDQARDSRAVGVVSTEPGFVGNIGTINDLLNADSNWKLLSMVGQVPVKVNDENGKIKIGDYITTSSVPGVGMKAKAGDPTIGIAEENYEGQPGEIKSIQVLITRNNSGIHNLVELKLGDASQAGFRINSAGKFEYRESGEDTWKPLADAVATDNSFAWMQVGDNVYSSVLGSTNVGLQPGEEGSSKLNVKGSIEARDADNFIKLSSDGAIEIVGYSVPIGIRVNPQTKQLEYRDNVNKSWTSLNNFLSASTRVEIDKVIQQKNQKQVTGWGYIKGDGSIKINLPVSFSVSPIVIVSAIGVSHTAPSDLTQCTLPDQGYSLQTYQIGNKEFSVQSNLSSTASTDDYYCFSWIARGN